MVHSETQARRHRNTKRGEFLFKPGIEKNFRQRFPRFWQRFPLFDEKRERRMLLGNHRRRPQHVPTNMRISKTVFLTKKFPGGTSVRRESCGPSVSDDKGSTLQSRPTRQSCGPSMSDDKGSALHCLWAVPSDTTTFPRTFERSFECSFIHSLEHLFVRSLERLCYLTFDLFERLFDCPSKRSFERSHNEPMKKEYNRPNII